MATRDEYLSLADLIVQRELRTQADFEAFVREAYGEAYADYVIANYRTADFPSPTHAFVTAHSDIIYHCPNRQTLRALRAMQTEAVYRAIFSSVYDDTRLAPYGAGHGMDVPYAFGTFGNVRTSESERALSVAMMDAWARFAALRDPRTHALPFAPYDPTRDNYLELDDTSAERDGFRSAICDGWDALGL
jgi:para-nitrobenzyl esterase